MAGLQKFKKVHCNQQLSSTQTLKTYSETVAKIPFLLLLFKQGIIDSLYAGLEAGTDLPEPDDRVCITRFNQKTTSVEAEVALAHLFAQYLPYSQIGEEVAAGDVSVQLDFRMALRPIAPAALFVNKLGIEALRGNKTIGFRSFEYVGCDELQGGCAGEGGFGMHGMISGPISIGKRIHLARE